MKIGILCGHNIKDLFDESEEIKVDTSYGSVHLLSGLIADHEVFFANRYGKKANLPPHKVNYKANIEAFHAAHVDCIISVGTVGSMNKEIVPGDFVIPHDFFDATKSRPVSFFDDKRVHVDMTEPFCTNLRDQIITVCENNNDINIHKNGVYVTTEGPRLESASEIRFYSDIGEIVGMTLVPEVVLAREKGMCFVSLCLVCNMAAGMQDSLSVDEIRQIFSKKEQVLSEILKEFIRNFSSDSVCSCEQKQKDALL